MCRTDFCIQVSDIRKDKKLYASFMDLEGSKRGTVNLWGGWTSVEGN